MRSRSASGNADAKPCSEVADSGPGFGHLPPQHGLGLIGVRRFAERFGGDFSVGTSSLGGALVTLRLPLMRGGDVHRGR